MNAETRSEMFGRLIKQIPNPINNEIYSQTDLTDLILSLETHGQLEPLVVNSDNVIISGHRRYFSITTKVGIEKYLEFRKLDVELRHIVKGRLTTIATHLRHFLSCIGKDTKLKDVLAEGRKNK